jgi:hypothetical protein
MKTCVVWGDMLADSASDQYPSVAVCDACAETESKGSEDQEPAIVSVGSFDPGFGDFECHFCGKTKHEEALEK